MAMIKWEVSHPLTSLVFEARTRDEARRQFFLWIQPMHPRFDSFDNEVPYSRTEFESEYGSELKVKKLGRA